MGALLDKRREVTRKRISRLRSRLREAERLCQGKACVYAIGSFGREETTKYSDLDIFIAGKSTPGGPSLQRLNQIVLKAELIDAVRKLKIPDFSGDGEYLEHYTVDDLVKSIGQPKDDARNTFTARVLLLLESRPLLEKAIYLEVIKSVAAPYWRDYEDHKNEFVPAYLANDILRLWRTFCVNYEARTATEPAEKKAKRKLKNYKLKHRRLLTCYSGLLYLLAKFSKRKTVTPADVVGMTHLTPTARLEWLLEQSHLKTAHAKIRELLKVYEEFLFSTDAAEDVLVRQFLDKRRSQHYIDTGNKLGDLVFEVFEGIGGRNRFHRLLVV